MAKPKKKQQRNNHFIKKEVEAYRVMSDLGTLAASLPQTAFLELALERISTLLEFDGGGLYRYNENTWSMELEVSKGISSRLLEKCKIIDLNQPNVSAS